MLDIIPLPLFKTKFFFLTKIKSSFDKTSKYGMLTGNNLNIYLKVYYFFFKLVTKEYLNLNKIIIFCILFIIRPVELEIYVNRLINKKIV